MNRQLAAHSWPTDTAPNTVVRAQTAAEAVKPSFTSTRYGDPGYAQLTLTTPAEISAGGEDGCEMGAYHDLYQPQRRGNLPTVLEEFVPWGCEAFVEFVT